ncbi:MAG: hypothetical protein Q3979_01155 [Actinomycetaceae bacterium]|nr:hypothetical protein [Actinomycetaceae bacterium]
MLKLAPHLTAARLKSRAGDAWLDVLAVLSFALSAFMALTVAGGIQMFQRRYENPTPEMLEVFSEPVPGEARAQLQVYFTLALVAGALLVVPIFSLGASAARLGAKGRAKRLASLRLVGVTPAQTVGISLVETAVQWVIGASIGTILYLVTLPAWGQVSFMSIQIEAANMRLSFLALTGLLVALLFIALLSTAAGLNRVRISPLGVARHEASPALKRWRLFVFIAAIVAFWIYTATASQSQSTADYATQLIATAIFIAIIIFAFSVVGPWSLQLLARPAVRTRSVPRLLAARRIVDDPKAAWRTVSALSLLCLIAGFVATVSDSGTDPDSAIFMRDIRTGVTITLVFGFTVAALSTLMNQSSMVFERAEQTLALSHVGFPRKVFNRTRLFQTIGPLALVTTTSAALGLTLAYLASAGESSLSTSELTRLVLTVLAGSALSLVSLLACQPLEGYVLASQQRKND